MTGWQYIRASLKQFRRVHAAVAVGVATATAVITGALLVGDSVRGSLRDLTMASLGRIDSVLIAERPFRDALAGEWSAQRAADGQVADVVPMLLTKGAVSHESEGSIQRATGLQVIGAPSEFWSLALDPAQPPVERGNELALTGQLARELGVAVGNAVLLRLPAVSSLPADSTLGEKEETTVSRRMKVAAVLDEKSGSLARFTLRPSQQAPRNVFVPLQTLQGMLELDSKANAVALGTKLEDASAPMAAGVRAAMARALRPTLDDFGLTVDAVKLGDSGAPAYLRIASDRLVLPPAVVDETRRALGDAEIQPVVTYLANRIETGDRRIPYSTVVGVDSTDALGPLKDESGRAVKLADDEITLNDWAAEDLKVKLGDLVTLTWYEPETTHGELREHAPLQLKLKAIAPLAADGKPTAAADPAFAPELPGVTDQQSIDDWKLPFELVEKIRQEDDEYWKEYRTTPKAFVSHALAAKLWGTRWGVESVLRAPVAGELTAESVRASLAQQLDPAALGMRLAPVKEQALAAATGTTPFDGLFLGFSFFLMASATMLTALLFRLGVEQRAREVGLLLAMGLSPARVRWLLVGEAATVAIVGAAVGAALGLAYARIMVHGLNTWWVQATAAPFLQLHVRPASIAIGFVAGWAVALATIVWSLRRIARLPARQLLAGDAQGPLRLTPAARWSRLALPSVCIAAALGLGAMAVRWEGEAQAGAFFGGGALVLVGALAAVRGKLRESATSDPKSLTLASLAARNARRNPGRTMLSLALAATASFLIVALSAFRLAPTERGTGGFDLLAWSDLPVHYDLTTVEGRRELGFSDKVNELLRGTKILGFRVRDGEDASCLNLYQTQQPRVLGAPVEALARMSAFAWANSESDRLSDIASAWTLLGGQPEADAVPMALDRNTAFYGLKLYAVGDRLPIQDAQGREKSLRVVGMLANSVLQGDVIISEANFLRLFPESAGRRFFLIRRGPKAPQPPELAAHLETQLEDFGFDAVDARERLAELMAVQNTYLSTFQSLGALGLLLGAVGLAVAQVRSVLERRSELALLEAAGFRRRRLVQLVLIENLVLLAGGLAIGCLAALAAVLPQALVEQAGAPWLTLALLLAIVAVTGAAAGWWAARRALRAPLIPALRGE